jgi:hypothetical protein
MFLLLYAWIFQHVQEVINSFAPAKVEQTAHSLPTELKALAFSGGSDSDSAFYQ